MSGLTAMPCSFRDACLFVSRHHRHASAPRGHKFSIAAAQGDELVGVVMVGRPVARHFDNGRTLEINRLCVLEGVKNASSFLLGAATRASFAMGYARIVSYSLKSESGSSMRAAGWTIVAERPARQWNCPSRPRAERDIAQRLLWEKIA